MKEVDMTDDEALRELSAEDRRVFEMTLRAREELAKYEEAMSARINLVAAGEPSPFTVKDPGALALDLNGLWRG